MSSTVRCHVWYDQTTRSIRWRQGRFRQQFRQCRSSSQSICPSLSPCYVPLHVPEQPAEQYQHPSSSPSPRLRGAWSSRSSSLHEAQPDLWQWGNASSSSDWPGSRQHVQWNGMYVLKFFEQIKSMSRQKFQSLFQNRNVKFLDTSLWVPMYTFILSKDGNQTIRYFLKIILNHRHLFNFNFIRFKKRSKKTYK